MKKFNLYYVIISIAILVTVTLGWIFLGSYLEMEKPAIKFNQNLTSIGRQKTIDINFSDSISGLSHLKVETNAISMVRLSGCLSLGYKGLLHRNDL